MNHSNSFGWSKTLNHKKYLLSIFLLLKRYPTFSENAREAEKIIHFFQIKKRRRAKRGWRIIIPVKNGGF